MYLFEFYIYIWAGICNRLSSRSSKTIIVILIKSATKPLNIHQIRKSNWEQFQILNFYFFDV